MKMIKIQSTEDERLQFTLAVEEICMNVIEHACPKQVQEEFWVKFTYGQEDRTVIVDVYDKGQQCFDLRETRLYTVKELVQMKSKGGFGLHLVNKIADKVSYERHNDVNICRLMKRLSA